MKITTGLMPTMVIVDFALSDLASDVLTITGHGLNSTQLLIQCYYKKGGSSEYVDGQQFTPNSIICPNGDTIVIDMTTADPDDGGFVVIMGGNFPRFVRKGNPSLG